MAAINQNNSDKKIMQRGEYTIVTQKILLRGEYGRTTKIEDDKNGR